jgi:DNA-binding transcriptional MerR regulator
MLIGELASKAGVHIQTIRFYERRRILPSPARKGSGYRVYGERDLETLRFIRQSQELGFTLQEIAQLVGLHRAIAAPPVRDGRMREQRQMAELARCRLEQVEQKLRGLKKMRSQLLTLIDRLETTNVARCPGREMRSDT